jgi:hypothetical protein
MPIETTVDLFDQAHNMLTDRKAPELTEDELREVPPPSAGYRPPSPCTFAEPRPPPKARSLTSLPSTLSSAGSGFSPHDLGIGVASRRARPGPASAKRGRWLPEDAGPEAIWLVRK